MSRKLPTAASDDQADLIQSGARWQFGDFELNEKRMELRRNGELVKLESKPLNLLMVLLRNPGELITKDDLVNALWPNGTANDGMLSNCVAKLRRELRDDDATLIKTVFRFGYRFDIEPRRVQDETPAATPPTLSFNPGDVPPLRPNWRLVRRLGLSGDSWLAEHAKSRARRVFKFSNDLAGLSALKREVTVYRLLRESLGEKVCYVDLIDWNFDQAPWFTEAEYCPAGSLQEWFSAQGGVDKLPFATRLELIIQIAEALAAVHAVGVLHKDLKPANIFVVIEDDGRPTIRLADFGASSLHDSAFLQRLAITRAGFTQMLDIGSSGNAAGTLMYLAPEVASGQPATVKADIYALGLMLYQFVTGALGRQLSTGWEAEVADEILREDIAAATEGNPERRLADAGEFGRRLRALERRRLERAAEVARRAAAERADRKADRARARRAWVIAAIAALVFGLMGTSVFAIRANQAREHAESEAARAKAVGEFLAHGMFAAVNEDAVRVREMPIKQLLDHSADQLPRLFSAAPDVQIDLRVALAHAYMTLDYGDQANAQYEAADRLIVSHGGREDPRRLEIAAKWITTSFVVGSLRRDIAALVEIEKQVRPVTRQSRDALAALRTELIRSYLYLGQDDRAEVSARALVEARTGGATDQVATLRLLGLAQLKQLKFDAARLSFERALAALEETGAHPSKRIIPLLCNLAFAEIETGKLQSAREHLREAKQLSGAVLSAGAGWFTVIEAGEALLDSRNGDIEGPVSRLDRIIRNLSADNPANPVGVSAEFYWLMIRILHGAGRYSAAAPYIEALETYQATALMPGCAENLRLGIERLRNEIGIGQRNAARARLQALNQSVFNLQLAPEHPFARQLSELARDHRLEI